MKRRTGQSGTLWDVIIVGAGPAGLSAALVLGRCRRRVLVIDSNRPRNAASHGVHAFLTRDGIHPRELRRIGREQLKPYRTVRVAARTATKARRVANGFQLTLSDGSRRRCRKLLLATGVIDDVPKITGIQSMYGTSVFHCPYCDGWENRDRPTVAYGRSKNVVGFAINLRLWAPDVVVCTDGVRLAKTEIERLKHAGIPWHRAPIARLQGKSGQLARVVFEDGNSIAREVMYFSSGQCQASDLAEQLGCGLTKKGAVATGEYEITNVRGLFVAGDASRLVQLAIVAAAEGAQAAFAINTQLMEEDRAE